MVINGVSRTRATNVIGNRRNMCAPRVSRNIGLKALLQIQFASINGRG